MELLIFLLSALTVLNIELCRRENVDFVLAVGGGSSIDSAKAIAAGTVYEGDFWDFYMGKPVTKALPVATILCTVGAEGMQEYQVEIVEVTRQSAPAQRSMVLKVTDERLLEKTGGIVQGMSGSPILQDGKLIGAVTHVLVNDPTRGYGIFIENMLEASE